MYSSVWAADVFDTAHMTFLFLVVRCCKCTKSKINVSSPLALLLTQCTYIYIYI